jgi:hypothetical protein
VQLSTCSSSAPAQWVSQWERRGWSDACSTKPRLPNEVPSRGRGDLREGRECRAFPSVQRLLTMPRLLPWLLYHWRNSSKKGRERAFAALRPFFERSIDEHMTLAEEAGVRRLYRSGGWLSLYRTQARLITALQQRDHLRYMGSSSRHLARPTSHVPSRDLPRTLWAPCIHAIRLPPRTRGE